MNILGPGGYGSFDFFLLYKSVMRADTAKAKMTVTMGCTMLKREGGEVDETGRTIKHGFDSSGMQAASGAKTKTH